MENMKRIETIREGIGYIGRGLTALSVAAPLVLSGCPVEAAGPTPNKNPGNGQKPGNEREYGYDEQGNKHYLAKDCNLDCWRSFRDSRVKLRNSAGADYKLGGDGIIQSEISFDNAGYGSWRSNGSDYHYKHPDSAGFWIGGEGGKVTYEVVIDGKVHTPCFSPKDTAMAEAAGYSKAAELSQTYTK